MAKLIIWVGGKPLLHGYKIREFHWAEKHGCFIYEGRELSDVEFNAKFERAWRNNSDLQPKVRVVETSPEVAQPEIALTTNAYAPREITLEEAEAVVAALAPDRLKKKAGRPPHMMEVA